MAFSPNECEWFVLSTSLGSVRKSPSWFLSIFLNKFIDFLVRSNCELPWHALETVGGCSGPTVCHSPFNFLTSHFTVLMSTVSSSYKVNNHLSILKEVPILCIKNSITARFLMCFNMVGMKYKANRYVHQAIPHGTQWNKFCLKVTLHAQNIFAEALLSEHCSYFLIQVSFTESCNFTVHTRTHTQSYMIHLHPSV